MRWGIFFFIFLLGMSDTVMSQDPGKSTETDIPDPKVAFLKSLAVPGWGHHYVDQTDWRRGQYHLAAEAILIISYFGLRMHSNNIEHNWYTYARSEAGVDIENRSRAFQLAVGDFENLRAYNDYQERIRNWDMLYDEVPENNWSWRSSRDRNRYGNLRNRFETIDRQLPALLSLMVVNRVISAVSAYNRARKKSQPVAFYFSTFEGNGGMVAHLQYRF